MFGGGGFDGDKVDIYPHAFRKGLTHGLNVGGYLGFLGTEDGVYVYNMVTFGDEQLAHVSKKNLAVDTFVLGICVGKMFSDIAQCGCSQKSIADGMNQYVGITMSYKTLGVGNLYST